MNCSAASLVAGTILGGLAPTGLPSLQYSSRGDDRFLRFTDGETEAESERVREWETLSLVKSEALLGFHPLHQTQKSDCFC